ncbi:MAG: nickel transporter [Planctomycetes bacterium]|nr:nickel transporter [Planctomycetota bacterium]
MIIDGLLAGAAHVLTGPDHLAGVAPLAVDRPRRIRPSLVGASWGLGHGLGVACLGVLGQTLLSIADVEVASVWAERLVGLVLILLGVLAIRRARTTVVHEHVHSHGGEAHAHLHVHGHEHSHTHSHGAHSHGVDSHEGRAPQHSHRHAAFGVGVVHGLAGAGHFWAVLPSLAMPPAVAATYIGSYLLATVVIMTLFGAMFGRLSQAFGERFLPSFLTLVGAGSILIGAVWLYLNLAG